VARIFDVPLRTIFDWLARYRSGGWHALNDSSKSGRAKKLSAKDMQWVYNAVTMGNPLHYQFDFCLWSLRTIGTMIKQELGIELSKSSVGRLLNNLGLSAQRPLYKSYKQDPKKIERYLNSTFPDVVEKAKALGAEIYFCR